MKRKHLLPLSLLVAILPFASCSDDNDENVPTAPGNEQSEPNNDQNTPSEDPNEDNESDSNESDSNVHEYVDLGLPSGTLWATCNIGASTPEECGDYFAWGETESKEVYDKYTYKFYKYDYSITVGNSLTITKYAFSGDYVTKDSLSTLQPKDDAATAAWGAEWRMPTEDEQKELINNCEFNMTEVNGIYGAKVTAKNGKSIFLPAAGQRYDLNGLLFFKHSGSYWSSSLNVGAEWSAKHLDFDKNEISERALDRYDGLPVRAVRSQK